MTKTSKRKSRSARRKAKHAYLQSAQGCNFFYPLYSGWTATPVEIPLFPSKEEALFFQYSKYMKDGIVHHWSEDQQSGLKPCWLSLVGGLSLKDPPPPKTKSSSQIEKVLYSKCRYLQEEVWREKAISTSIFEASESFLLKVRECFAEVPDYHSSSQSIYKRNTSIPQSEDSSDWELKRCFDGIPLSKNELGAFQVCSIMKEGLKDKSSSMSVGK